jgi:papain like protease
MRAAPGRPPTLLRSLALTAAFLATACVIPSRSNRARDPKPGTAYAYYPPGYYPPPAPYYPDPQQPPAPPPPVTAPPPPTTKPPPVSPPTAPPRPAEPPPPSAGGCGQVRLDGVSVPLDCPSLAYARILAQKPLLRATFTPSQASLPEYVDHRYDRVEGPVRHQRRVGSGAALALAGALDQALLAQNPNAPPVSALLLWGRARTSSLAEVVRLSLERPIGPESALPYDEGRACAWSDPAAQRLCKPKPGEGTGPDPDTIARAEANALGRFQNIVELNPRNVDEWRETIAKNRDVLAVVTVDPAAWQAVHRAPATPEPQIPDYNATAAVHTVTLVGYAHQDNAWFFLIKNSWGPAWGVGGYAWMSERTLRTNLVAAFTVQVATNAAPPPGAPPTASCPQGQAPDAVTKQCAPACPDKSPRTNGVCPTPNNNGGCPPGFVNTTGRCVVAAPDRAGLDPQTKIVYACGQAGCTYTWPRGVLGCRDLKGCSLSCAAPKFLAAVSVEQKTISCTE